MPTHTKTALILGANGSFGSHAVEAFANAGWNILAQTRTGKNLHANLAKLPNVTHTPINIEDDTLMAATAKQANVIVNALNPPYKAWAEQVPRITTAVLKAVKASTTTLILPGNVYNYGANMPPHLTADTPHCPTTNLGNIRETLEQAYRAANVNGVKIIIFRMGDFLMAEKGGNWFDSQMTGALPKGKFTYPGERTTPHAWAYLPDAARTLVQLAEISDELPQFSDIPFAGTTFTGNQMATEIGNALGHKIKTGGVPWPLLKIMALFSGDLKGVMEMRYLWNTPHALDGGELTRLLPNYQATPTAEVIKACVARYN
ncbi:MAG: NmrA family NAD(P)-binding protein [Rhizobiaceae bacterium]